MRQFLTRSRFHRLAQLARRLPRRGPQRALAITGLTLASVMMLAALAFGATRAVHGLLVGAPSNDAFSAAATVTGANFSGSAAGATAETAEVTAGLASAGDATVWYRWTPSSAGWASLLPGGATTPRLQVFTGSSLSALHRVDQSDPSAAGATSVPVIAGLVYLVQADAVGGSGGEFTVDIVQPKAGAPANDAFAAATDLSPALSTLAGSTTPSRIGAPITAGATAESGEPAVGGVDPSHSVWYTFVVPAPGAHLTLTVSRIAPETASPPRIAVWRAAGTGLSGLSPVASSLAGGPLSVDAAAATTYYISLDGDEQYDDLFVTASGLTATDGTPPLVSCTPPTGWVTPGASVPCTASDAESGLANPQDASFSLAIPAPSGTATSDASSESRDVCDVAGNCVTVGPFLGIKVDGSPPKLVCDTVPQGWFANDVTVTCQVTDDGSGLAAGTAASFTLTATVAAGATSSAAAFPAHDPVCDAVGNCTPVPSAGTAKIDRTPPAVTCDSPPSGWSTTEVSVTCHATDSGAGLASGADSTVGLLTQVGDGNVDGSAQTATRPVCDAVGNCATAGPVGGIEVDRARPVVQCTQPTGWTAGTAVTVPCTSSDQGSGLADATAQSFSLSASIPAGSESDSVATGSRQVCDLAGNCTAAGPFTGLRLDDAAPALSCAATPTGWLGTSAEVSCTSSDLGSGLKNPSDGAFMISADIPAGTDSASVPLAQRQVCDVVGHCVSTSTLAPAKIDHRGPDIHCGAVPAGVSAIEVTVRCTAADGGSGLADAQQAAFLLRTSVGAGDVDHHAMTSSLLVCDAVSNCVTAGPFAADVDRTLPPPGRGPSLAAPFRVAVLAAVPGSSPGSPAIAVPVPYAQPTLTGGAGIVDEVCAAKPGSVFAVGTASIHCTAIDDADRQAVAAFWLQVAEAPELAPSGPAAPGAGWRAVGADYAAGSTVAIELDGRQIATTNAGTDGVLAFPFTMPSGTTLGPHLLVARGAGTDGTPLLVVTPLQVAATGGIANPGPTPGPTSNGGTTAGPSGTTNPTGSASGTGTTGSAGGVQPVLGGAPPAPPANAPGAPSPPSAPAPAANPPASPPLGVIHGGGPSGWPLWLIVLIALIALVGVAAAGYGLVRRHPGSPPD